MTRGATLVACVVCGLLATGVASSAAGATVVADSPPATTTTTTPTTTTPTGVTTPTTDDGGASVPTVPTLPAAPAGFPDQLTTLYASIYHDVQESDITSAESTGGADLPTTDQYDQLVSGLTTDQLAALYDATQKISGWGSLPTIFQGVSDEADLLGRRDHAQLAALRTKGRAKKAATPARVSLPALLSATVTSDYPPAEPVGSFPAAPLPYQPSAAVGAASGIASCPPGAPGNEYGETSIYATDQAAFALDTLAGSLPDTYLQEVASAPVSIDITLPDPALVVAAAAASAAHVLVDTFNFEQAVAANCESSNLGTYLANIDNTTVNAYELTTDMETTLDNVEGSVDTLHDQVTTAQQTVDDELTLSINQALTATAGSPANAAYELPASQGGYLDSTPIGVQEVVSSGLSAALAAGLPVNPAASGYLTSGNAALAAGSYAQAFADYVTAYQDIAQ